MTATGVEAQAALVAPPVTPATGEQPAVEDAWCTARGWVAGGGWLERTLAWLHQYRRLRIRWERRADIHESSLKLAVCLICWRRLHRSFSLELQVSKCMNDIELVVGGMTCRRCVREVTSRLRDVPGVERVTANPPRSLVHLSGSIALAHVLAAFEETTYRPVVQRGA